MPMQGMPIDPPKHVDFSHELKSGNTESIFKKHFPSEGEASLCGVIVDANPDNGLANNVSQFINGGELKNTI